MGALPTPLVVVPGRLVVLAGVLALGASCNLLSPLSPDQLGETRIRAICHLAFGCCTPIERQLFANAPFKDEGACVAESLEDAGLGFLLAIDAEAKDAVDRGAAEIDSEAAERCTQPQLDAVNQCEIDKLVDANGDFDLNRLVFLTDADDPECVALAARNYTRGLVDDGDDCLSDFDCKDFGACVLDPDDVDVLTTKGTCKALVGEGDDCSDAGCLPGLVCTAGAGANPECQQIDLKPEGEACFGDGECNSNNCADVIVDGTCFGDGTPCVADEQCVPGDFCAGQSTSECAAAADKTLEICDGL